MLEIPFLEEIVAEKSREAIREATRETSHRNITVVLEARFGDIPHNLVEEIESVVEEERLESLVRSAGTCGDLAEFRRTIAQR